MGTFARLAKLQAFDNGNKRTVLISANLFLGAITNETNEYLTIPIDFRRARFDANLIEYYMADDWDDHMPDVAFSASVYFLCYRIHKKSQPKSLTRECKRQKKAVKRLEKRCIN